MSTMSQNPKIIFKDSKGFLFMKNYTNVRVRANLLDSIITLQTWLNHSASKDIKARFFLKKKYPLKLKGTHLGCDRFLKQADIQIKLLQQLPVTPESYFMSRRSRTYMVVSRRLRSLRCVRVKLFGQDKRELRRLNGRPSSPLVL